jgi:hypothetical protein
MPPEHRAGLGLVITHGIMSTLIGVPGTDGALEALQWTDRTGRRSDTEIIECKPEMPCP